MKENVNVILLRVQIKHKERNIVLEVCLKKNFNSRVTVLLNLDKFNTRLYYLRSDFRAWTHKIRR